MKKTDCRWTLLFGEHCGTPPLFRCHKSCPLAIGIFEGSNLRIDRFEIQVQFELDPSKKKHKIRQID